MSRRLWSCSWFKSFAWCQVTSNFNIDHFRRIIHPSLKVIFGLQQFWHVHGEWFRLNLRMRIALFYTSCNSLLSFGAIWWDLIAPRIVVKGAESAGCGFMSEYKPNYSKWVWQKITIFRVATTQGKQGIWKSIFPDRENTGNLLKKKY